jgi:maleate isomerase
MPEDTGLEYAPKGLIGVLTPQANTTVEPEYAVWTPPGFSWINARMTSDKAEIADRLVDYAQALDGHMKQFANAPVQSVAFGTTGASYLIGHEREDQMIAEFQDRYGIPLVMAATAICAALALLGARRIGLVSPYPPGLTEKSVAYWQSRGLEVVTVSSAYDDQGAFHPIYALTGAPVSAALQPLLPLDDLDAIVLLGTGMPTVRPIQAARDKTATPIISCMLALVWASVAAIDPTHNTPDALKSWLAGDHWRAD